MVYSEVEAKVASRPNVTLRTESIGVFFATAFERKTDALGRRNLVMKRLTILLLISCLVGCAEIMVEILEGSRVDHSRPRKITDENGCEYNILYPDGVKCDGDVASNSGSNKILNKKCISLIDITSEDMVIACAPYETVE